MSHCRCAASQRVAGPKHLPRWPNDPSQFSNGFQHFDGDLMGFHVI